MTTTVHKQQSRTNPRTYSFEDIERWMYVHYNGERGWVVEKGNILENTDAKHIRIRLMSDNSDTKLLHSNVVNKYLDTKETLWVDFEHDFTHEQRNNA